jgi:hypothetical protein
MVVRSQRPLRFLVAVEEEVCQRPAFVVVRARPNGRLADIEDADGNDRGPLVVPQLA